MTELLKSAAAGIQWLMNNFLWVNMILIVLLVFFERKEPKIVWAWMLVLYFMPILGFVLYLLVGQNYKKKRMFRLKEVEDELKYAIRKQEEILEEPMPRVLDKSMERFDSLIYYNLNAADAVFTVDNDVDLLTDGKALFGDLASEIENAREYIHILSYIIKRDEVFEALEKDLERKVLEGVEVRILVDAMGGRTLHREDFARLRDKGIEVEEFFPAVLGKLQPRFNYRNHRKIIVIDGRIGYVGGFNIGREYLGWDKKMGYWRDTHLKLRGSSVISLNLRFILDWNYAAKDNLFEVHKFFMPKEEDYVGEVPIQIISSGPDSRWQNIRNNYLRLFNMARRNIYIQTPYFIPDETILQSLRMAALSGVDVRIMIPCKPDHPFVYWATYSYIGDMLEAGARCYTYDKGFLHAKGVVVDGMVSCCGTANMDIRSFKLNFEVNATIYDKITASRMEEVFRLDLEDCTEITKESYGKRGLYIRFREQFSRLLSPVL